MNTDPNINPSQPRETGPENHGEHSFTVLRKKLQSLDNGRVPVPGLGVFVVRTVDRKNDGSDKTKKSIRLRLKNKSAERSIKRRRKRKPGN